MTRFLAAEADFLFDATFALFWGKLRDFDSVNHHGIRVMGFCTRVVGEGVVGLVGGL